SWLPHRFAALSDRLTLRYGIGIMGAFALLTLWATRGDTGHLVMMYSINVFITFTLTELGMCRLWIRERKRRPDWKRHLPIHAIGLVLCSSILVLQVVEKFAAGGFLTLVVTSALILLCCGVRGYYRSVQKKL